MKILPNDGISKAGIELLEKAGFEVVTEKVAQEQLVNFINDNNIDVLLVRSATKVRKDLIDATNLKIIGRGGVGMDNIDVEYAKSKGIHVINTPAASSISVAELVFAHFFSMVRYLHDSNRVMPLEGDKNFEKLKKAYSNSIELKGKKLGIIGFGRIGQEAAKIGIGLGMSVIAYDKFPLEKTLTLEFFDGQKVDFNIKTTDFDTVLKEADFITLHTPKQEDYVIGENEFDKMKDGVIIANAARGGVVDEVALVKALEKGKVRSAALDVFENEPTPEITLLMNPSISLSPHIGANTLEAQERIGTELAEQIIDLLKDK